MRFVLLLLLLVTPVFGIETVNLDEGVSQDILAVQALIDQFGDQRLVCWPDPVYKTKPVYAVYAEAAGSFGECAVDPLIEALCSEELQIRLGGAIGLEAVGPAAIQADYEIVTLLESQVDLDNIMGCCIIRGIGSGAVELVPNLQALLRSDNFHVQYWACRGLSSIGANAQDAIPDLFDCLENGVASVRRNAALALGNISLDEQVREKLEAACNDRQAEVREAAKEALRPKASC